MTLHDRIDPDMKVALDALLAAIPGGFNAVPDIIARRAAVEAMLAAVSTTVPLNDRVMHQDRRVPGPEGAPDVGVRVYRTAGSSGVLPGIFYIHGGGMVMGDIASEHAICQMLTERADCVVVSVEYRLAPEHPFPAAPDDCYAALSWMSTNANELGVDSDRIAVYGGSAGGGLACAMTLMARDRNGPPLCFQMAIYPMIDDSHSTGSSQEIVDIGLWDRLANVEAWGWYLGGTSAPADVSPYAAPTRATDLSGLPPAYIDVGDLDLFRDENIAYATRLLQAGVPTEFHINPGAYHAAEVFAPEAATSQRIWAMRVGALQRALHAKG